MTCLHPPHLYQFHPDRRHGREWMRLVVCGECHKFVGYRNATEKPAKKRKAKPVEFEESEREEFDLWR